MLDGQRVRLESIDADRKDLVLVQDDAAMPLPSRDLKALGLSKVDQLAVLFGIYHNKDLHSIPTLYLLGWFGKPTKHSIRFQKNVFKAT